MKLTEGGRLQRPNLCFLCETTPDHGTKVIDTERYFDGHPFNLQGRRYVCEKCINSMLVHFDLADRATVERAENDTLQAQRVLQGLKRRIDILFNDLRQLAENPTALMEEIDVTPTGSGSGTVGEVARVEVDPGSIDGGAGEDLSSDAESGNPERGSGETAKTYSGASLTTSPYAQ